MLLLIAMSCKHPYNPPEIAATNQFLVVDGLIDVGSDASPRIVLSRTQNLSASDTIVPELYASVSIEQEGGATFSLGEQGNGVYSAQHLNLDPNAVYRVNITRTNGSKYNSDFIRAKVSPPIDSLTWEQQGDVTVYVYTHDPTDSTKYYRWDYTETWSYSSYLQTPWAVSGNQIYAKDSTNQTDSCWRIMNSTDIVIASSAALDHDVISHSPITKIYQNDERISRRYSILVRQYALTKDAYQFHQILQKNTEQTGSLYDPQPSQLSTNLHCLTNPNEPVIGFISASTVEEMRLFIEHGQVTSWNYPGLTSACTILNIPVNPVDFTIFDYPDTSFGPYYFVTGDGLMIVQKACTDCTYWGGSNVRPSFW